VWKRGALERTVTMPDFGLLEKRLILVWGRTPQDKTDWGASFRQHRGKGTGAQQISLKVLNPEGQESSTLVKYGNQKKSA